MAPNPQADARSIRRIARAVAERSRGSFPTYRQVADRCHAIGISNTRMICEQAELAGVYIWDTAPTTARYPSHRDLMEAHSAIYTKPRRRGATMRAIAIIVLSMLVTASIGILAMSVAIAISAGLR